jgi:hypothetical protein
MIDMNLAKSPSYIVGAYPRGKVSRGAGVVFLIVALMLIPLGAILWVKHIFAQKEIVEAVQGESEWDEDVQVQQAQPQRPRNAVRDIMGGTDEDADNAPAAASVELPVNVIDPEKMSRFERINYEVKFMPLLLEEFARLVPQGITFNSIRIFNFESVVAEGTSPSRALVSNFLAAFRSNGEEWELLPRPQTTIREVGNFYEFRLEAKFTPATLKIVQDPIDPAGIPTRLQLDDVKNRVVRLARSSGLHTQGLVLASSVNERDRREFTYNLNFTGNFQGTVNFLRALTLMREPIRSQNLTIRNTPQGRVQGSVQILITVK